MERPTARSDAKRDAAVLRSGAAREPADLGFHRREVHVPQRAPGQALRHPGVTGPEFRRVELTTDQRSGVFTQASVLTVSSYPTRTVVLRGKYLLENVLNAPPPPRRRRPGARERVSVWHAHRDSSSSSIARPGVRVLSHEDGPARLFAENYDAIGRWRTEDGKLPIDPRGELPNGRCFSGPAEMKALLRENMPEFTREKMLTYALGRGVEPSIGVPCGNWCEEGGRGVPDAGADCGHRQACAVSTAARRKGRGR